MKIAVLGYGVVGSGVVELITKNYDAITKRAGESIDIKYILDIRDFSDNPFADKFTKSFETIINDDEVETVVEVIGGINPSFDFVKRCLEKGKHVVTSNKELVAVKGAELINIASETNTNFLFEASVGGGIPIIRPLYECLAANQIDKITGILNGTTNFILTKMIKDGVTFDEALKEAQALGYAERNPAADVEGIDAVRKICILASLTFGKHVYPENIHTEGITKITLDDARLADSINSVIKLLGIAERLDNDKIAIKVCPTVISKQHPLAGVEGVFNGILVTGDAIGDVMFYGQGAGKLPTASAVVADVIDCVKHKAKRKMLYWKDSDNSFVLSFGDSVNKYLIRLEVSDKEKAAELVSAVYPNIKEIPALNPKELAFITDFKKESEHAVNLGKLSESKHIVKIISKLNYLE